MEPAVSVPSAPRQCPAASAAAEPPLEPPGIRPRSQGFDVPGVTVPQANSCVAVLPRMRAPAARSRATTGASAWGTVPASTREFAVVGVPATSMMSLIPMGIPQRGSSLRRMESIRMASAWAAPGSQAIHARSAASDSSMRSRHATSTSLGETAPDLSALRAPERVVKDGNERHSCGWWTRAYLIVALPCGAEPDAGPPSHVDGWVAGCALGAALDIWSIVPYHPVN